MFAIHGHNVFFGQWGINAFSNELNILEQATEANTRSSPVVRSCPHGLNRSDNTGERRGPSVWWVECRGEQVTDRDPYSAS